MTPTFQHLRLQTATSSGFRYTKHFALFFSLQPLSTVRTTGQTKIHKWEFTRTLQVAAGRVGGEREKHEPQKKIARKQHPAEHKPNKKGNPPLDVRTTDGRAPSES